MVYTLHNPDNVQYFPIKGFVSVMANNQNVQVGDQTTTVAEYFRSKYNVPIQYVLPFVGCNWIHTF
jgi:hypothetical protein